MCEVIEVLVRPKLEMGIVFVMVTSVMVISVSNILSGRLLGWNGEPALSPAA